MCYFYTMNSAPTVRQQLTVGLILLLVLLIPFAFYIAAQSIIVERCAAKGGVDLYTHDGLRSKLYCQFPNGSQLSGWDLLLTN